MSKILRCDGEIVNKYFLDIEDFLRRQAGPHFHHGGTETRRTRRGFGIEESGQWVIGTWTRRPIPIVQKCRDPIRFAPIYKFSSVYLRVSVPPWWVFLGIFCVYSAFAR
jgi:hypothetical protein